MSGAHSVLPPSGASSWRACPMWVTMNNTFGGVETPETIEGTAAHHVAWSILEGEKPAVGDAVENGGIVTDEMLEGGHMLIDHFKSLGPFTIDGCETTLPIDRINTKCFGTPDLWGYNATTNVLHVVDYKFGHRFVDEFQNDQGVCYITGILDYLAEKIGIGVGDLDRKTITHFTIAQPRCYVGGAPIRTWSILASDLRGQINQLSTAAGLALGSNPEAITNKNCQFCPGRHACVALQTSAYSDAEFALTSTPVELDPMAASLELRMLEHAYARLGARIDGLSEVVMSALQKGHRVPFQRLQQTYGRQAWDIDDDTVISIGDMMGIDLRKSSVLTPAQSKKLGVDESVIKAYSKVPLGKLTLVADNNTDARRVFGQN